MAVPSPTPSGQLHGAAPRPRRNYALDILRIVSIVGVVAIHSLRRAGRRRRRPHSAGLASGGDHRHSLHLGGARFRHDLRCPGLGAAGACRRCQGLLPEAGASAAARPGGLASGVYLCGQLPDPGPRTASRRGAGVRLRYPGLSAPLLPLADPGPVSGRAAVSRLREPGSVAARRCRNQHRVGADPGAVQLAGRQHPVRVGLAVSVEHPDPVGPLSGLLHGRLGHHPGCPSPAVPPWRQEAPPSCFPFSTSGTGSIRIPPRR